MQPALPKWSRARLALRGMFFVLVGAAPVRAEVFTFTIDSALSPYTYAGDINGILPVEAQAPGSLQNHYQGTFNAEVDWGSNQIQFLSTPTLLLGIKPGPFQPGNQGGNAAGVVHGIIGSADAYFIGRDHVGSLSSAALDLDAAGNFDPYGVHMSANGFFDVEIVGIIPPTVLPVTSGSPNLYDGVGNLHLDVGNNLLTLTLPTFHIEGRATQYGLTLNSHITGTIVAHAVVPEASSALLIGFAMAAAGGVAAVRQRRRSKEQSRFGAPSSSSIVMFAAVLGGLFLVSTAKAEIFTFTIFSAQSPLSISGNINGILPLTEQSPGSLDNHLQGTFDVDVDLALGQIRAIASPTFGAEFKPGPFLPGNQPANVAGAVYGVIGSSNLYLLARDHVLSMSSGTLAMDAAGNFNPYSLIFSGRMTIVGEIPGIIPETTVPAYFGSPDHFEGLGNIHLDGNVLTFTLPEFSITGSATNSGLTINQTTVGHMVAYTVVPEANSALLVGLGIALAAVGLGISAPSGKVSVFCR